MAVPEALAIEMSALSQSPTAGSRPLPAVIGRQLHALSARALHVAWLRAALLIAAGLPTLLLLQMGADRIFDLSFTVRALVLALDILALGSVIYFFGIRPWRQRLTPLEAARRAEAHWPTFRTSLISSVQLASRPHGSRPLIDRLIADTAARSASVDFRSAIATRPLRKLALAAIGALVVAGAVIWLGSPDTLVLLRRVILSSEPLPTQTIVEPISGDLTIQRGESFTLAAKALGYVPASGRIEITYEGEASQTLPASASGSTPDVFSADFTNVQKPFTYRFSLYDGRSEQFSVTVVEAPVLESVGFRQKYPDYTGLESTELTAGNLTLLVGGSLHIEARASQPLSSATLHPEGGAEDVPLKISEDGLTITGDLPVPAEGLDAFSIRLQDTEGVSSKDDILYRVATIPDTPPTVTFDPGASSQATLTTTDQPRIQFSVQDDFSVDQVELCWTEGTDAESATNRIPLAVPATSALLTFDEIIDPAAQSIPWTEDTKIQYWIEATDNNIATGPGVGRSHEQEWHIVSLATMREQLAEKLRQSAEAIETLSRDQENLRQNSSRLLKNEP